MTPELFEKKLRSLERRVCCLIQNGGSSLGPCEYDSVAVLPEQTGGIGYSVSISYVDPPTFTQVPLFTDASVAGTEPQDWVDELNVDWGPGFVFSLNEDGTLHLVSEGLGVSCFLSISVESTEPNAIFTYDSPNSVEITGVSAYAAGDSLQGDYNGPDWGFNGDSVSEGYMPFDISTDILEFSYTASIPSPVTICVVITNGGYTDSFQIDVFVGSGSFQVTGLNGLLDGGLPLLITIDGSC
jgi:hypothetical protein